MQIAALIVVSGDALSVRGEAFGAGAMEAREGRYGWVSGGALRCLVEVASGLYECVIVLFAEGWHVREGALEERVALRWGTFDVAIFAAGFDEDVFVGHQSEFAIGRDCAAVEAVVDVVATGRRLLDDEAGEDRARHFFSPGCEGGAAVIEIEDFEVA